MKGREHLLENRDYTVIFDSSGSMSYEDCAGGLSRWKAAEEGALALTRAVEKLDPDGLTLYFFATRFQRHENVTSQQIEQRFRERNVSGSTGLAEVLEDALGDFAKRKRKGELKANGEMIIVVTDGEPNDRKAVEKVLITASKGLDRDEELAVLFLQIGRDNAARNYLRSLDDDLVGKGAKFDIVDVTTFDEAEELSITELLLKALDG